MKPYPAYKDSGIEWIGEIPSGWNKTRLAYVGQFSKGRGIARKDLTNSGVPVILYGDIYTKYNIQTRKLKSFSSEEVIANAEEIHKGDLLLTGSGETKEDIGKCVVYLGDQQAFAGGDIIILRPSGFNSVFVSYILNSPYLIREKAKLAKGEIVVHIYSSQLRNIPIPTPSLEEQTAIANFLDHKTAQIDAAIEKHRRLIELLQEHRAALINEAVTKGINPNAPMKDSGIEWVGEVPEHWDVKKVKHFCQIQGRIGFKGYKASDLTDKDNGALAIGGKHISPHNKLDLSNPTYLSWEKYYESPEIMVEFGHIIVTQRGTLGKVVLIEEDIGKATINPSMILLKEIKCNKKFLYHFLQSSFILETINLMNTATAVPMISQSQLANFIVLSPPPTEQQKIVDYIETEITRIDKEIALAQQEIDLLEEYRQSLIAEAVTGKIDVRDYPLED